MGRGLGLGLGLEWWAGILLLVGFWKYGVVPPVAMVRERALVRELFRECEVNGCGRLNIV